MDVMLPGADGFEICRQLREKKDTPVIIVSARRDDIDKIRGLGLGADDYMVKPFSPSELVARVTAHIKRYERLTGAQKEDAAKLIETDGLEYQLAKQVFNIICRAGSHKGIFNVEDQKKLDELKSRQKNICENIRRGSAPNRQVECLDIVGSLEQIVQRGCYKV